LVLGLYPVSIAGFGHIGLLEVLQGGPGFVRIRISNEQKLGFCLPRGTAKTASYRLRFRRFWWEMKNADSGERGS
jgi:hypothetical protein